MSSETAFLNVKVICGSLRSGSFNRIVAANLADLAPPAMRLSMLDGLADFPLYDADLQSRAMPGIVSEWGQAIRAADGIVIVTPEYNYSVPGVLKNALDWLSRLPDQPFETKPVAIQTASPGKLGGVRAQYHLRQSMVFLGAHVLNRPEVMISGIADKVDPQGRLSDQPTLELISLQLAGFAAWIERLKPS